MKRWSPLAAALLLALAVRVAYSAALAARPALLEPVLDAAMNVNWARGWLDGMWPGDQPFFRAPGAIWGIAAGLLATADDPVRLARMQILLGALTPLLTAWLARSIFGVRAAWIAGIGAALEPMLPFHDGQLLDSFVSVPLFLGAVIASWHSSKDGRRRSAVLAGLLWGAVGIVRPPLLLGALVAAAAFARGAGAGASAGRALPRRARFVGAMLLLAGALVLPLAVSARNAAAGDPVFIASQGGLNLYLGNSRAADGMSASFPDDPAALGYAMVESASRIASSQEGRALRPSEVSRHWTKRALEEIRADPGAWGRLMAKKSLLFWSRREIPNNHDPALFATMIPWWGALPGWGWWAPFGVAGFLLMRRERGSQYLAGMTLAVFASAVAFFVAARFRLPALPLLIVLAAGGVDIALSMARYGRPRPALAFVFGGLLLVVALRWNPYRIPETPWIGSYVLLAEAEKNRGELAGALGWIEQALQQEPRLYAARRAEVDLLRRLGRFAEGREAARRLAEANPNDAAALADWGVLLDLDGDSDAALSALDQALRIDPELDAARVHRGVVLARRGEVETASEEMLRFLRDRPRSAEAARARSVLDAIERGAFGSAPVRIDPSAPLP